MTEQNPSRKSGLGRGLSALFGDADALTAVTGLTAPLSGKKASAAPSSAEGKNDSVTAPQRLPIELLSPGPYQPRRHFDDSAIEQLATSIKAQGLLQPILVRRAQGNKEHYEIIAGERRWRAAQKAGLHDVPVLVRSLNDRAVLEVALVENLQRQDLTALEEAEGYQRLLQEFNHTHEALGKVLGKSRSHVANMLRLLGLPEPVKSLMQAGDLSAGHARALLMAKDPMTLARQVIDRQLSVRQTEELVRQSTGPALKSSRQTQASQSADMAALEQSLTDQLGLKVSLKASSDIAGTVTIRYGNLDEFDALMARLTKTPA